jgi:hypothetical protein
LLRRQPDTLSSAGQALQAFLCFPVDVGRGDNSYPFEDQISPCICGLIRFIYRTEVPEDGDLLNINGQRPNQCRLVGSLARK